MSTFQNSPAGGAIFQPKVWLIDMDDTLYSASAGMFHDIHVLMDDYIVKALGVSPEKANQIRKDYWRLYGVTYYGLWLHHGINPHDFLTATHRVDVSSIHTYGLMRQAIGQLKGKKILFTNAPNTFADKVLHRLGLQNCFDDQFRAEDMKLFGDWRPKPSAAMFKSIAVRYKVLPQQCCVIDDNLNNLKVAKAVGMQTLLCKGWHHHGLSVIRQMDYIDGFISHIRDIRKILITPKRNVIKHHRPRFLNPYN